MKNSRQIKSLTTLLSISLLSGCAANISTMPKKEAKATDHASSQHMEMAKNMSPTEMTAAWEKAAEPTQQHNLLKDQVGKWDVVVKIWMDPKAQPEISKGVSLNSLELNGKFLKESFSGKWMGHPFTGNGFTGYDTVSKEFTSIWMDSSSPIINTMKGQFSPESKSWTFTGNSTCPVSGATMKSKMLNRVVDKNHRVVESYYIRPDGSEVKTMEIAYSRAKS